MRSGWNSASGSRAKPWMVSPSPAFQAASSPGLRSIPSMRKPSARAPPRRGCRTRASGAARSDRRRRRTPRPWPQAPRRRPARRSGRAPSRPRSATRPARSRSRRRTWPPTGSPHRRRAARPASSQARPRIRPSRSPLQPPRPDGRRPGQRRGGLGGCRGRDERWDGNGRGGLGLAPCPGPVSGGARKRLVPHEPRPPRRADRRLRPRRRAAPRGTRRPSRAPPLEPRGGVATGAASSRGHGGLLGRAGGVRGPRRRSFGPAARPGAGARPSSRVAAPAPHARGAGQGKK